MLGSAQVANAADMRLPMKAPPLAVPMWSWTGFYVGVHGGYGGNHFNYPFEVFSYDGAASLTSSGGFGGGQIGYNWQTGTFLLGIEADIAASDIKGRVAASAGPFALSAGSKIDYFGTVRGRLGLVWDRFMVYGTGGFAYGKVNTYADADLGNFGDYSFSRTRSRTGWAAGGGFEYAVTNNLTVKTEYVYIDLGTSSVYSSGLFSISTRTTAHTVKAGLNWKFM